MKKVQRSRPKADRPLDEKFKVQRLEQEIIHAIRYFQLFNYSPTLEEIYTFVKKRCSKRALDEILKKMEREAVISIQNMGKGKDAGLGKESNHHTGFLTVVQHPGSIDSTPRYTLGEYDKNLKSQIPASPAGRSNLKNRYKVSISKIERILPYVKLLALFPQIKLIGLSGSVAMLNADKDHDVDLFIITAKNRLFTGRFIALLLAQMFGIRRPRHPEFISGSDFPNYKLPITNYKDKVCLNLFFDESNMVIPKHKQSEYVAHEVLQMKPFDAVYPEGTRGTQGKPLKQKNDINVKFLDANKWVFDIFPNARENVKFQNSIRSTSSVLILSEVEGSNIKSNPKIKVQKFGFGTLNLICNLSFVIWIFNTIESLLKNVQLHFINKHKTTEIITSTQLWFHPDDFEKKLSNLYKIKSR